jgi:hypothetical protein
MATPVYTVSGQPVSEAACGEVIEFDVPGYSTAWVIVEQNGRVTFNDIMSLPMPPYRLKCPDDVGMFTVSANTITAQGGRGNVIGATRLNVTAAATGPNTTPPYIPVPPPTPPPVGQPPYTPPLPPVDIGGGPPIQFVPPVEEQGILGGLDLTTIALFGLAAVVLLPPLFKQRKG